MSAEINVNDGKGLYDNLGLIDLLVVDCNELPKLLMQGQYVGFCVKIVEMVQKLSNLKRGVKNDQDERDLTIRNLQDEVLLLRAQIEKDKGDVGA